MLAAPTPALLDALAARLGPHGFSRDPHELEPYLTDWRGRYHGKAAALLSPANRDEVVAIVKACADAKVAIVPQGGNTGMVGGATPDATGGAVVLSLKRMRAVRTIDVAADLAICEAGVVLADLHAKAEDLGRRFPLSLGAKGSATIGGLCSTNAGGVQVLRFGTMRSLVHGVEAVLPDGSLFEDLQPLKKDNRGYSISQLLIGAEGTLGVITAASLRLYPKIGARTVAWIGLASPENALILLRHLERKLPERIESFELVPKSALDLVLQHIPNVQAPLAQPHPWNVLVEATVPDGSPAPDVASALEDALDLIEDAAIAANETQAEGMWRIRESISEAEKKDGPAAKHDISVPVSAMPGFVVRGAADIEKRFPGTRVNAFGHLGDGNIHFNVRAPVGAPKDWVDTSSHPITEHVHDLVTQAGGSISAEHGIGQMKRDELARLSDPARMHALRAIKTALDPHGIMNPGKLL
ncbi:MAG: FAD-binding oxidoreductase [Deltaproteobacteria bacterium]|nr:FAD-binding oxidoreductase [Deltaproteobacteria bacterium]